MMEDIKKSLSSILAERTTSPFFGTLIVTWMIWNWKIIYLTFFVSEDIIKTNKIDYIVNNYSNYDVLLKYPILSTIILLTIIPFISNGAFWLTLRFNKWKKDQRNIIEGKQLLSLEQSIELREQILSQEVKFEKLLENKSLEIKQLKSIIDTSNQKPTNIKLSDPYEKTEPDYKEMANKLKYDKRLHDEYDLILYLVQIGHQVTGREDIRTKTISLLESNDIITNKGNGIYQFTESGKKLQRLMSE